jgi:hypothetical protein
MRAHEMTGTRTRAEGDTHDALIRCIAECFDCAQACTICADACLQNAGAQHLTQWIRLCRDCADVCNATAHIAARRAGCNDGVVHQMIRAAEAACRRCAEEGERHAGHDAHCRICAEAARACERACHEAATSILH